MFRWSLRLQITTIFTLVNLLLALLVAYLVYTTSSRHFDELFLSSKLALANALADSIDGDAHVGFRDADAETQPEYQRVLATLNRVKSREDYVTYLYTVNYDAALDGLYYAVDADIADSDILWVESDYFALWCYFSDGRLVVAYEQDEHTRDFEVEIRDGVTLPVSIEREGEQTVLRLGKVEFVRTLQSAPLVVATPVGRVDLDYPEREWQPLLEGQATPIVFGFSGAGQSISMPGSIYVDTPENEAFLRELIVQGQDFVEPEAIKDNYGFSISAYGIIRTSSGKPIGAVIIDFYQREMEAFRSSLRRTVRLVALTTFGIVLVCSLLVAQYLLVPVKHLASAVRSITEGHLDTHIQIGRKDEFGQLAEGFNQMVQSINQNLARRHEVEAQLSQLAYFDQLTGLLNRKSFHDRLDESLTAAQRSEHEKLRALLFLDLDRFKDVNDTLGHQIGDQVLKQAATRIRAQVRNSDLVFRQGGDEFTVLLGYLHDETDAALVAEKLVNAFATPILVESNTLHVGLSVGIAVYPRDGSTGEELIRAADTALFEAKRERMSYRYFTHGMQEKAFEKLAMVTSLHRGIVDHQFALHFQPMVDMREKITGGEALLRWSHPERGDVAPGRFLPMAEETGLIVPLGQLGIRAGCQLIKDLEQAGISGVRVAVNLSPRQLAESELVSDIDAQLEAFQVDPGCLELEITEFGLMEAAHAIKSIEELRRRGIRFAIDDFGTGYSSLARLRTLPIDTLKVDRTFVAGIPRNQRDIDLIHAIITIAHSFGQKICAEGVESLEQQEFLRKAGCDMMQGYLFGHAVPADVFIERVGQELRPQSDPSGS